MINIYSSLNDFFIILIGHQQAVNHIAFSPDARFLASASFDKKVKLWCGKTGRFLATLSSHVGSGEKNLLQLLIF